MKPISTKMHGALDYPVGLLLIISPWIFNFNTGGPEQRLPVIIGVCILFMSLFTNYEFGGARLIPMRIHLAVDVFAGLFLALSPWLFGFKMQVFIPHLVLGLTISFISLLTSPVPFLHRSENNLGSRYGRV